MLVSKEEKGSEDLSPKSPRCKHNVEILKMLMSGHNLPIPKPVQLGLLERMICILLKREPGELDHGSMIEIINQLYCIQLQSRMILLNKIPDIYKLIFPIIQKRSRKLYLKDDVRKSLSFDPEKKDFWRVSSGDGDKEPKTGDSEELEDIAVDEEDEAFEGDCDEKEQKGHILQGHDKGSKREHKEDNQQAKDSGPVKREKLDSCSNSCKGGKLIPSEVKKESNTEQKQEKIQKHIRNFQLEIERRSQKQQQVQNEIQKLRRRLGETEKLRRAQEISGNDHPDFQHQHNQQQPMPVDKRNFSGQPPRVSELLAQRLNSPLVMDSSVNSHGFAPLPLPPTGLPPVVPVAPFHPVPTPDPLPQPDFRPPFPQLPPFVPLKPDVFVADKDCQTPLEWKQPVYVMDQKPTNTTEGLVFHCEICGRVPNSNVVMDARCGRLVACLSCLKLSRIKKRCLHCKSRARYIVLKNLHRKLQSMR